MFRYKATNLTQVFFLVPSGLVSSEDMRDLGHEKNSQHAFIKRVILRESFLSVTWRIISTRAIGMCPSGYLTA